LINSLREKTGRFGGCWDVVVWRGDATLFLELKRQKKDAIQNTQVEWLSAALESGLTADNFALVEWVLPTHESSPGPTRADTISK